MSELSISSQNSEYKADIKIDLEKNETFQASYPSHYQQKGGFFPFFRFFNNWIKQILLKKLIGEALFGSKEDLAINPQERSSLLNLGGQLYQLKTPQGEMIESLFFSADEKKELSCRNTILLVAGSHASFDAYVEPLIKELKEKGLQILVVNPVGFGNSEGTPSPFNYYLSIETAYQFLKSQSIDDQHIFAYGYSLGGFAAAELASHHPVNLILDRCYSSAAQIAREKTAENCPDSRLMKLISFLAGQITRYVAPFNLQANLQKGLKSQFLKRVFIAQCSEDLQKYRAADLSAIFKKNAHFNPTIVTFQGSHEQQSEQKAWLAKSPSFAAQSLHEFVSFCSPK